ncbi:hypothetical protein Tco_0128362 [Tanacetum coccineum]
MHNNIMAAGSRDHPLMLAPGRYAYWQSRFLRYIDTRPNGDALRKCILEGVETILNMSPKNKEHYQSEKEAIHLLLNGIGAFKLQLPIHNYQQNGESLNIQDVKTNLFWEFGNSLLMMRRVNYQKDVNEIRSERLANNANPLALVAAVQQYPDPYYKAPKPHKSYAPTSKQSSSTRSIASTKHKGKEIAKPITPSSESASEEDSDLEQAQRDKKPKRVRDYTYYKEKMLLCKQAEKGVPLQTEQADWLEDTDEEIDEQELDAHYGFMAKIQEVLPPKSNSNAEPLEQTELENCMTFNDHTVDYEKLKHKLNETLGLLAQKEIDIKEGLKLKAYEISVIKEKHDELVKQSLLTKSHYEGLVKEKTKVIMDLKSKKEKDIDKMISMEKQLKFFKEIVYKRNQSIQTINLLAPKGSTFNGRSTFANPMYLKKAQSEKLCLYEIPYDTSDIANKFIPDRKETLTLKKETSKEYHDQLAHANEVRKKMWRKSELVDQDWEKHFQDHFRAPTAHDMEILIKTFLMPLALKTQNDSFTFVYELKQKMHADIKYVESHEKEIDELESDKAEFPNMYDLLLQDELKKLIKKCKGKSVETNFDKPSVIRQPNAQRIPKPSVLGKPTPFSDSLERKSFSKTKSVPKTNVSESLSKLVTTQILPQTARQVTFRNSNPRVPTSTGVTHRTSVSRSQLKITQMKDKFMPNNSQVNLKKTEVGDQRRISSNSNKTKFVPACNDSLNSRTSNVNAVCATCGKCLFNLDHYACVSKILNDVNARTKKPNVVPISTRKPKRQANKYDATLPKKKVASESTIQNSKSYYRMLYEKTSKAWKWWIEQQCTSGYKGVPKTKMKWVPKTKNKNMKKRVSFAIDNVSMINNVLKLTNLLGSNLSNVPSSSNSLADCSNHPIQYQIKDSK